MKPESVRMRVDGRKAYIKIRKGRRALQSKSFVPWNSGQIT